VSKDNSFSGILQPNWLHSLLRFPDKIFRNIQLKDIAIFPQLTAPEAREMSVNRIAGQVCLRASVREQQRSPRGKNPDGTVVQVFNGLQFIACLLSRRMEEKE